MAFKFNTIDDFDLDDKTVIVRVDINAPVDPMSGEILDDNRLRTHAQTLNELHDKGAKIVILAHQSRAGKSDFTTLEKHAEILSKILNKKVEYVDSIFNTSAREKISNMYKGDILLLENVRFYSEETLKKSSEEQAQTLMVKNLAPLADLFVNDAFAAAHRSQASLVGFTGVLPSAAGRIMESELKILYGALDSVKRPCLFVLGGVKADDSIDVMENVLKNGTADMVLTSGLIANIFLVAQGKDIGESNRNFISSKGYDGMVDKAKNLLEEYGDAIKIPLDVAVPGDDGERLDVSLDEINDRSIWDIGVKTISEYARIIRESKTIFANGPAGVFENPNFVLGTSDLLNAIAYSDGFSIIGGGHVAAAAVTMGYKDKMDHISTGGGASLNLLAGEVLPVVKALMDAYKE